MISNDLKMKMLEVMLKIRHFEQKVKDFHRGGLIRGGMHVYIGEEAVATGACFALKPDDYVSSTHRGHGHCIAKGGDLPLMMAELLGKKTGYCKGKGGSMHIADLSIGILGANGIVGGGIPMSVGAGLSAQYRESSQVCLCFFGDGAANQGDFHESLNLASLWKLPVVFICENNQFGMTVAVNRSTSVKDIGVRAASYGIPGDTVDGMDVIKVYDSVSKAVKRAREGDGPTLIEAKTYRFEGHWLGDPILYRTKDEVDEWREKDPINGFKKHLIASAVCVEQDIRSMEKTVIEAIQKAEKFALESPEPELTEAVTDVYADEDG